MLLGIPGDNTFANCQEANRALWRLTLLPQVDKVLAALTRWLGEAFGDAVTLAADRDALPALASEREALWARLGAAAFLTPNEKRAAVGLDPVEGGDRLEQGAVPRPVMASSLPGEAKANRAREQARMPAGNPEGGQFASEGGATAQGGRADEGGGPTREAPDEERDRPARKPAAPVFREDRKFIEEQEGNLLTTAEVPKDEGKVFGRSGATIGAGVDLGQQSEDGLRRLGIDDALIEKVKPWLGKTGEAADRFLMNNPLSLSAAEARELTDKVEDSIIRDVARNFDRASKLRFADLPSEAQTVIADLAIQFGANLATRTPDFWGQVTSGDWDTALRELQDFKDDFAPRRNREAKLLKRAIDAGTLPQPPSGSRQDAQ